MRRRLDTRFTAVQTLAVVAGTPTLYLNGMVAYGPNRSGVRCVGPMTRENRARFERARTKRGRPRQGQGAQAISVTVERRLLAETDALAKALGITRAGIIARGLKAVLAAECRL
jgi:hypothetical protein